MPCGLLYFTISKPRPFLCAQPIWRVSTRGTLEKWSLLPFATYNSANQGVGVMSCGLYYFTISKLRPFLCAHLAWTTQMKSKRLDNNDELYGYALWPFFHPLNTSLFQLWLRDPVLNSISGWPIAKWKELNEGGGAAKHRRRAAKQFTCSTRYQQSEVPEINRYRSIINQ